MAVTSNKSGLKVCVPCFASLTFSRVLVTLMMFIVSVTVLYFVDCGLTGVSFISRALRGCRQVVIPVIFVKLKVFVLMRGKAVRALLNFWGSWSQGVGERTTVYLITTFFTFRVVECF